MGLCDAKFENAVSVVIPFGYGAELLREQLLAVYNQDTTASIEIVVACNFQLVDARSLELPTPPGRINLVFVDATSVRGPAYARNVGWKSAISKIILFCDADDVVGPSWVSAMLTTLLDSQLAGGRLSYAALNDPDHASWNKQTTQHLPRKFQHLEFVPSSNLGVQRQVLEQLNGFDESLVCGEDIDFCWRAQYKGFKLSFAADAVVEYRLRDDLVGLWRQSLTYGISDAPLLLKHSAYGARRPFQETLKEAAAIVLALITVVRRPKRLRKFIVRAGMFAGRVLGSVRHKKWVV